ncbi:putative minor capsid protein [Bacillus mycoides]|uniref:putative minor capsid protein n=1 Tax=Bacillus mycoides TaxID=1405 RepID=UPI0011EE3A2D|nr:putative minor capsid protein [Bacillus mycoides]QEL88480.1 minor capsid protein [Bacillus mycoides]
MINIIPIPMHMLIHTVEYHEYIGEDDIWGGSSASYAPPVVLKRVRVQPNEKVYITTTGDSVTFQSILFHDSINSEFPNHIFKEKSKIVWNGKEMFIKEVEPLYTTNPNRPHHTELYLQ